MIKNIFHIVFLVVFFVSCKRDETIPNKLPGKWTDENSLYQFLDDKQYSIKYLRNGSIPDTVLTDSLWGTYIYQTNNDNLSFAVKGIKYRKKMSTGADSIRLVNYNGATWNITFKGDSILQYQSSTALGFLKKVK